MAIFTRHVDKSFVPPAFSKLPTNHKLTSWEQLDHLLVVGDKKKTKAILRNCHWPAEHPIRHELWQRLCSLLERDQGSIYHDVFKQVFGQEENEHEDVTLPTFVEPSHMNHYHLTEHGTHVVKKVICIIGETNPDITWGPAIFAVTSLFLHYLEEEQCFNAVYSILRCGRHYLTETKIAHEASKYILRDLAKKYAKSSYTELVGRGLAVERVVENWLWWIFNDLPFHYMVRVVDVFLYEGPKVLYRVALAILQLFHRHVLRVGGPLGQPGMDLGSSINQFVEDIPVSIDKLFKTAYGIRGLSRKEIHTLSLKHEMLVKSKHNVASVQPLPKSVSCDSLKMVVSRSFSGPIHLQSHVLEKKELDSHAGASRQRSHSHGMVPFMDVKSSIITLSDWQTLYAWLPRRITMYQPRLIYTTAEHGTSLNTFYRCCQEDEPTLLVIRTNKHEIIGAYCSVSWEERKKHKGSSYFGTGETFLFVLQPHCIRYQWIGIKSREDTPASGYLFMAGDDRKITIGGGGGEALQLDQELLKGRSERCDTFQNSPLVDSGDFLCTTVEVFTFF